MGFLGFGSKWTMHVDGGSSKIYDEDKAFTIDEDFIIKSVLHKTKFANTLNHLVKNGYSNNLGRLFRYARDNWSRGTDYIDISSVPVEYSNITSDEEDYLSRELMKNICSLLDVPYDKYEHIPVINYPLINIITRGKIVPKNRNNNIEDIANASVAKLFHNANEFFLKSDIITGNTIYKKVTKNIINNGTEEEPEEEEITREESVELNTSLDLINKFIVEDLDDKYFIVTIPFVEGKFTYVNGVEETGIYTTGSGENTITNSIYTVYYDYTKITKVNGSVIYSNREIRPRFDRNVRISIEPLTEYGNIYSSEFWLYGTESSGYFNYDPPVIPMSSNHPNSINVNNLPLYEFDEDSIREVEINGKTLSLYPNQVLVRKNSKIISIEARVKDSESNIVSKTYARVFGFSTLSEEVASLIEGSPSPNNKYPDEYFNTFPSLPVRDRNGWRHQIDIPEVERRLSRIVGLDMNRVSQEIWDDAGEAKGIMQFIYFHNYIGSKPKHEDKEVIEFLFRYFQLLEEIQAVTIPVISARYKAWLEYEPEDGKYKYPFFPPRNSMSINSHGTGNEAYYYWNYVAITKYTGTGKEPRWFYKINDNQTRRRLGELGLGISYVNSGTEILTYCKRDKTEITEVSAVGLIGKWGITSYTHRGGWDSINHTDKNVLLPIPIGLWDKTNILIKEAVASRSAHITYLAAQWNKKSGWSRFTRFAFDVIRIASLALTVVNVVAGTMVNSAISGAGALAGNVIFNKLAFSLVLNYIKSKLVTYALSYIGKELNMPYLSYIYEIFNTFSGELDFNITNVLKLTNNFSSIVGSIIQSNINSLMEDMKSDSEYWKQAMEEIEEAQNNLKMGRNDKILEVIVESPSKFFGRTFADTIEASFSILESDYLYNFDFYLE